MSKRQCSIFPSTYAVDLLALRTVTDYTLSLRYILHCLGCNAPSNVTNPTRIFDDNLSVILNAQNLATDLSKKCVVAGVIKL